MATTSADLAAKVLDSFVDSEIGFAVLHGEAAIASGNVTSDVDIVSEHDPLDTVQRARGALAERGLHVVMLWRYDVGAASAFVVDATAHHGAQIDMIHDPRGSGSYGIRSTEVLAHAQHGIRWHRSSDEHELLYSIRKRIEKGQVDRLEALLARASATPTRLDPVVHRLFSHDHVEIVMAALSGRPTVGEPRFRKIMRRVSRVPERLRNPPGFWVAIQGADAQETSEIIAARFGRILPITRSGKVSGRPSALITDMRTVLPVRMKAGLLSSWGARPTMPRPDLHLRTSEAPLESMIRRLVVEMEASTFA